MSVWASAHSTTAAYTEPKRYVGLYTVSILIEVHKVFAHANPEHFAFSNPCMITEIKKVITISMFFSIASA